MPAPVSLTTMAALAVTGIGAGLYLGKSAVAQINPIYFSSPYEAPSKFYADLVPGGAKFEPSPARLPDASLAQGLGSGCVLCPAAAQTYAYTPSDYGGYEAEFEYASYVEFPAEDVVTDAEEAVEQARETALRNIERYAHFPVSAQEAAEEEAEPVRIAAASSAPEEEAAETPATALAVEAGTTPGI